MDKKGFWLVLLTAVISGVSVFVNSFGVAQSNAYVFTFLKNLVVSVFLVSVVLLAGELKALKSLTSKQWSKLLLIAVVGGSVPFLLFFRGLQLTTAASGSFIHKTMFVYVAILAALLLKEKLDKRFIFGAVLLLLGNLLLLGLTHVSFGFGDLLVLAATLFWAVENVISKSAVKTISPNIVASSRMFLGSLLIFVFLAVTNQLPAIASITFSQLGWVLVSVPFLILYLLTWYNGIKYIDISKATCILLVGSPITTVLSILFAGKQLLLSQAAGMLLVVIGVVVAADVVKILSSLKYHLQWCIKQ